MHAKCQKGWVVDRAAAQAEGAAECPESWALAYHSLRLCEKALEAGALDEAEFVKGCLTDPDFSRVIQHSIEKLKLMADD